MSFLPKSSIELTRHYSSQQYEYKVCAKFKSAPLCAAVFDSAEADSGEGARPYGLEDLQVLQLHGVVARWRPVCRRGPGPLVVAGQTAVEGHWPVVV